MANNYGAFSELPKPTGNDYGAYLESRPSVFSSKPKKTRSKAADVTSMNPLYKPKASPGPIGSAANVRENRVPKKATRPSAESFSKPNKGTRPMGESTKSGKKTTNRGSWRQSRGD